MTYTREQEQQALEIVTARSATTAKMLMGLTPPETEYVLAGDVFAAVIAERDAEREWRHETYQHLLRLATALRARPGWVEPDLASDGGSTVYFDEAVLREIDRCEAERDRAVACIEKVREYGTALLDHQGQTWDALHGRHVLATLAEYDEGASNA